MRDNRKQLAATFAVHGMLVIFLVALFNADAGEALTRNVDSLPESVGPYAISPEVREKANLISSNSLRLEYLTAIVTNRTGHSVPDQNFKKASAIRLLGAIRDTNSISVLVSVIEFVDVEHGVFPAVESLGAIGEPAIPHLLDVVRESPSHPERLASPAEALRRVQAAVQALRRIKGDHYLEFAMKQKDNLPDAAWRNLLRLTD